jgi:hypothetical protein
MCRSGSDLEPGPISLGPISGATNRPNVDLSCGLDGPMGSMGRPWPTFILCLCNHLIHEMQDVSTQTSMITHNEHKEFNFHVHQQLINRNLSPPLQFFINNWTVFTISCRFISAITHNSSLPLHITHLFAIMNLTFPPQPHHLCSGKLNR